MYFFSRREAFPVCGMYSFGHLIFLLIIGTLIGLGLHLSKDITQKGLRKQTLIIMIVLWVLEIIKIGYNHLWGYFGWDQWVPLAFCSLLLYAGWFALSKNETIHKMGAIWIIAGGLCGGLSYLLYPSTSLTEVQGFHFLAFHGMGYHGTMVYLGILYFVHSDVEVTLKNFKYYLMLLGIIFPIIIVLDYTFNVNLMFFHDAYNLPGFVKAIAAWNLPVYTLIAVLFYLILPYFVIFGVEKLRAYLAKKKEDSVYQERTNE